MRTVFLHCVVMLFFSLNTQAATKSPVVEQFITGVKVKSNVAAFILEDYHHRMTTTCRYEPGVNEFKRFIIYSEYYVDLLAFLTLVGDENQYKRALDSIPCAHGKYLMKLPISDKHKKLFR